MGIVTLRLCKTLPYQNGVKFSCCPGIGKLSCERACEGTHGKELYMASRSRSSPADGQKGMDLSPITARNGILPVTT